MTKPKLSHFIILIFIAGIAAGPFYAQSPVATSPTWDVYFSPRGGDLRSLIRHNVRRYRGAFVSEMIGWMGKLLLSPLEPLRSVDCISPIPLVMINGTADEQIPRANAELLYRNAREPKKIIWLESMHVHPRNPELTARIIRTIQQELLTMGILEASSTASP
jgi:hypothetical protein